MTEDIKIADGFPEIPDESDEETPTEEETDADELLEGEEDEKEEEGL